MNTNVKKSLLIFGGGLLIFLILKRFRPLGKVKGAKSKKTETKVVSEEDKKNAAMVLTAYKAAKKAGEKKEFLDEMNAEAAKDYGMRVYTDKGTGKLFVADLEGNKVL